MRSFLSIIAGLFFVGVYKLEGDVFQIQIAFSFDKSTYIKIIIGNQSVALCSV